MVNRNRFAWKGDTCCCRGVLFHLNLFVESQHQPQPAGHFCHQVNNQYQQGHQQHK